MYIVLDEQFSSILGVYKKDFKGIYMFDEFEQGLLTCGYFDVISWEVDSVEIMSNSSKHYWILKKFTQEGYPGLVLYHSHEGKYYHVHFCYPNQDIAPAISEIMEHDRYMKKKLKLRNKITQVSNHELLRAIS